MISSVRKLLVPVLLFSLAGCGLKGPLYLPDARQEQVPGSGGSATQAPASAQNSRIRRLPPAPQAQKREQQVEPSQTPTQSAPPPVSPPDPDRPTTPPPQGQ